MAKVISLNRKEIVKEEILSYQEGRPMPRANIWINIVDCCSLLDFTIWYLEIETNYNTLGCVIQVCRENIYDNKL